MIDDVGDIGRESAMTPVSSAAAARQRCAGCGRELPISASQVQAIRLYRAWEAQQKYGNDVMGGVIEVTTKQ